MLCYILDAQLFPLPHLVPRRQRSNSGKGYDSHSVFYMCVCVYVYMCVCICVCMYVYMCVYMCVCMYIYVCMYIGRISLFRALRIRHCLEHLSNEDRLTLKLMIKK